MLARYRVRLGVDAEIKSKPAMSVMSFGRVGMASEAGDLPSDVGQSKLDDIVSSNHCWYDELLKTVSSIGTL